MLFDDFLYAVVERKKYYVCNFKTTIRLELGQA